MKLKIIFIRYDKVLLLKQYKYIISNIFIKYSNMSRNIIDLNSLKKYYLTENNSKYFTSWLDKLRCEKEPDGSDKINSYYHNQGTNKTHKRNENYIKTPVDYRVMGMGMGMDMSINVENPGKEGEPETSINKISDKQDINYYIYNKKNHLFWIFYILLHGYDEYNYLNKSHIFGIENKIRFELIDELNSKKEDIKMMCKRYKIKYDGIIQNLGNGEDLEMDTFKIICILKNINIIFKRYCFIEIMKNDDSNDFYCIVLNSRLHTNNKKQTTIKTFNYNLSKLHNDTTNSILKLYDNDDNDNDHDDNHDNNTCIHDMGHEEGHNEKGYIIVNSIEKAVKSIGNYKLSELQYIANKIGINIEIELGSINTLATRKKKNKRKVDLYQEIMEII